MSYLITFQLHHHLLQANKSLKNLELLCAIMPSKYTDEIENSSYTWRVFLCLENQNIV